MDERWTPVFIYGSLLPGHSNHHLVSADMRCGKTGLISGRLVDCGPYPALLRDREAYRSGACVRGLWVEVNDRGLKAMDELEAFHGIEEENDYDRVWAEDLRCHERRGWVYVWDHHRGCPAIEDEYWPDYWVRKTERK